MMIYTFSMEDFEAYLQRFSEALRNKKMFLSLDYPTLRLWMREYLHVSNFQDDHHLVLAPPPFVLHTFGYLEL